MRLAINQETSMRVVLAVMSPLAFVVSFAIFSGIGYALVAIGGAIVGVAVPSYLLEETGIFVSAVVWLLVGIWLVVGVTLRGAAQGTGGTPGSREAESQPRVR